MFVFVFENNKIAFRILIVILYFDKISGKGLKIGLQR